MKIARNDPCPCGSGKKYKRCHLDHDKDLESQKAALTRGVLEDQFATLINSLPGLPGVQETVEEPATRARRTVLEKLKAGPLEGKEAAEALEVLLESIEAEIRDIASRHSRFFWLFFTRRLAPDPIMDASEWTVDLYRTILDLAVIKHGLSVTQEGEFDEIGEEEQLGGTRLVPKELAPDDVIAAHQLEFLAHELNAAATAYRRVGKGAVVNPVNEDWYVSDASEEIEALMQLRDRRAQRYGEFAGAYGALVQTQPAADFTMETYPFELRVTDLNTERRDPAWIKDALQVNVRDPTTFNLGFIQTSEIREVLNQFEAEVKEVTGTTPDVLLAAIWSISINSILSSRDNPLLDIQLLKTGYRPHSASGPQNEDFVARHARQVAVWWKLVHDEELDQEQAEDLFAEAIDALTYTEEAVERISLWDRLPFKMVLPATSEGFFILDHAAMAHAMIDLFREVGFLEGSAANVKAARFEHEVADRARERGINVWEERQRLKAADREREIDLGVIIDRTLYVIECKAFSQNPRIDRGDFAALKGRQKQLEKYLRQAETLADFLRDNPRGRNYAVPDEVEHIEHLLCTPSVEYLWSTDQELWLRDPQLPRICVVDELLGVLSRTEKRQVIYPAAP